MEERRTRNTLSPGIRLTATQKLRFSRALNSADAGFFFLGRRPECNVAMVMLGVLREEVPLERARDALAAAGEEVPRFKDFLQPSPLNIAPPRWMPKQGFDVRRQIHEVRLSPGAGWRGALDVADKLQSTPFPEGAPPWEILFLTGLPEGRSLMAMKVHHSLSDGTALALLFAKAFGGNFLAESGMNVEADIEAPPDSLGWHDALTHQGRAVGAWLKRLPKAIALVWRDSTVRSREMEALKRHIRPQHRLPPHQHGAVRRLSGFRVPVDAWNRAARQRRGTPNDLYLAIVANAVRRHFTNWDLDRDPLQAVMPVNIRNQTVDQDAGNVTGVGVVSLSGCADDMDDLLAVSEQARAVKRGAEAAEPSSVDELITLLPGAIRSRIQFREFATRDIVASNVPMPIPGELCDVPFEMMFMVAPAIGASMSFTLTSYVDHYYLATNADCGLVGPSFDECLLGALRSLFGELAQDLTGDVSLGTNAASSLS